METKEYNGRTYQPLETFEEAESLLGKKLIGGKENCNTKTLMIVTKVKLCNDDTINVSGYNLTYLFRFYTHEDGSPIGKVVEDKFELPKILAGDWYYIKECLGLSIVEVQIRNYIIRQGWTDTKPWSGMNHYSIFLERLNPCQECEQNFEWGILIHPYENHCGIFVDTVEHAEWLCEQLNKAGIVL